MPIEIERKFLVNKKAWEATAKSEGEAYRQGYLLTEAAKTIRVRLTPSKGFLTIKGKSEGASRLEYEYEIPQEEAKELLDNFASSELSKDRFKLAFKGKLWEVDVFHGKNEGLTVAEIELESEEESFEIPEWISKEVTGEHKYFNSSLTLKPFKSW